MLNIEKIKKELDSLSNGITVNTYAPGSNPSLGISIPMLRKIAKKIAKENYKYFIENMEDTYLEYQLLKVMVLGYAKDDIKEIIKYFKLLAPIVHDWCVCDTLCQGLKISRNYQGEFWNELVILSKNNNEYSQRIVAVIALSHFLNEEYIDKVLEIVKELTFDAYYTKMGVAWCIATAYAKFPEKTYKFMLENKDLDTWTYNKSIQKMIESFRVSNEDKEKLKLLKKKATD